MKRLLVLALVALLTPIAAARVWVSVYRYDGKTSLAAVDPNYADVYRDIMVGTRLTLVVRSDSAGFFLGNLWLSWEDAYYGRLSGRGKTPPPPGSPIKFSTYEDSRLHAAGTKAWVRDIASSRGIGLELRNDYTPYITGGHPAYPGDWFVVDYHAEQVGPCDLGLYSSATGLGVPIQTLSFTHVPSRDFNDDAVVNLKDFALLASQWRCAPDPQASLGVAADLDARGSVDFSDLGGFSAYWLARTDDEASTAEPNDVPTP